MKVVREGEANWPQQDWLLGAPPDANASPDFNLVSALPVSRLPPQDVLAALRACLVRHESLRSLLHVAEGEPARQQVTAPPRSDRDLDAVVEVTTAALAPEVLAQASRHYFDISREWPIRAVLSMQDGRVNQLGLVADHSAVDAWGIKVLREELELLLTGGVRAAVDPLQPLDLSNWERTDAGQTHLRRALRFWGTQLGELSAVQASPPGEPAVGEPRFRRCSIASESLLDSAEAASRGCRVSMPTVFLAAFGAALCEVLDRPVVGIQVECLNRPTRSALHAVGKMNLRAPVVARRDELRSSLGIRALYAQQTAAQRWAHANPVDVRKLCVDVLQTKCSPSGLMDIDVAGSVFNYVDGSASRPELEPLVADRDKIVDWSRVHRRGARRRFWVLRAAGLVYAGVDWKDGSMNAAEAHRLLECVAEHVTRIGAGPDR